MEEMVELVATLQEYHYLITYGDYLSILVKQLKAAVPPATIPEMEKKSVCEIAGQVRREMRGYRAWIGAGEKQPAPKVFMLRNIDAAANQMKIFGHDVIFMMQTHAERNDHGALKGQQVRTKRRFRRTRKATSKGPGQPGQHYPSTSKKARLRCNKLCPGTCGADILHLLRQRRYIHFRTHTKGGGRTTCKNPTGEAERERSWEKDRRDGCDWRWCTRWP